MSPPRRRDASPLLPPRSSAWIPRPDRDRRERRFRRFLAVAAAATGAPGPAAPSAATSTTLRQASTGDPLRVLVVGDSLMGWIGPALEQELAGQPVEVIDEWEGSTGLARPDYFDWPARVAELVAAQDPDVIVVGFGGNDTQSLVVDGHTITRDDPAWPVEYARRVRQVLDAAGGPPRTLWWIGLPPSQRDNVEALRPAITGAVTQALADAPWARYVDTRPLLAPDGTYQVALPGPDGRMVTVRSDDGIHLTPDGGRFVVRAFVGDLRAERGLG